MNRLVVLGVEGCPGQVVEHRANAAIDVPSSRPGGGPQVVYGAVRQALVLAPLMSSWAVATHVTPRPVQLAVVHSR